MTHLNQLKLMKDDEIQAWLKKVGRENAVPLAISLLGADDDVRACVFRNLSTRARAALDLDIHNFSKMGVKDTLIQKHTAALEKLMR